MCWRGLITGRASSLSGRSESLNIFMWLAEIHITFTLVNTHNHLSTFAEAERNVAVHSHLKSDWLTNTDSDRFVARRSVWLVKMTLQDTNRILRDFSKARVQQHQHWCASTRYFRTSSITQMPNDMFFSCHRLTFKSLSEWSNHHNLFYQIFIFMDICAS